MASPEGATRPQTSITSEIPLDPATARAIDRLVRDAAGDRKVRLVAEFTLYEGELMLRVSKETKDGFARTWRAGKPARLLPLYAPVARLVDALAVYAERGVVPSETGEIEGAPDV